MKDYETIPAIRLHAVNRVTGAPPRRMIIKCLGGLAFASQLIPRYASPRGRRSDDQAPGSSNGSSNSSASSSGVTVSSSCEAISSRSLTGSCNAASKTILTFASMGFSPHHGVVKQYLILADCRQIVPDLHAGLTSYRLRETPAACRNTAAGAGRCGRPLRPAGTASARWPRRTGAWQIPAE